jgi:tRNA threonylcarbamoyl adenosine modification protein (Sua5/YciO/YrdC/YwlC family)
MSASIYTLDDARVTVELRRGAVGIIPSDTIYGLAAAASNPEAVVRLYALKARERKPGTIIAASTEELAQLGVNEAALQAVKRYWPNPLSIVIPASDDAGYLHQRVGSLAVRIPSDDVLLRLLRQTGPLLTSSANRPGQPPANTVEEARHYFGDEVDFYVDGGDRSGRPPSTVARYTDGKLTVLRQGAVTIEQ